MSALTVGSLFSGIGGLDLGLERAGMTVRWQSEIDPYACRVLAKHWPDVPNLGDVTTIKWEDVERVDLVCGGFPCQPVSQAGKRLAQADERWLWPEVARCLRGLRPDYLLVENVPGLLVRGMGDILGDLAALGYEFEWDCLPAAALGAHHRRFRVFLVAHAVSGRREQRDAEFGGLPIAHSSGSAEADPDGARLEGRVFGGERARQQLARACSEANARDWLIEPDVGRVAHGVPARVDRLRALGNAVVPQVAEWIGRRIVEAS